MAKVHAVTQENVENMDICFNYQILTQIVKVIFDSYMGPCLSTIKYGTIHDSYLKGAKYYTRLKGHGFFVNFFFTNCALDLPLYHALLTKIQNIKTIYHNFQTPTPSCSGSRSWLYWTIFRGSRQLCALTVHVKSKNEVDS